MPWHGIPTIEIFLQENRKSEKQIRPEKRKSMIDRKRERKKERKRERERKWVSQVVPIGPTSSRDNAGRSLRSNAIDKYCPRLARSEGRKTSGTI